MNAILSDLLTILSEVQTQVEDGSLEFDGISASNIEYITEIIRLGRKSTLVGTAH